MSDRRRAVAFRRQLRLASALAIVWSFGLLAIAVAGSRNDAEIEELFLDPAYLAGSPWYTGLFTNIGILAWTVAVVAAAGGAWVAARAGRPSVVPFLASAAAMTALLLADDLFQLHADVLPSSGMHALAAKIVIVAPVPVWTWVNRNEIVRTRWLLLACAFAGFGASLLVEMAGSSATSTRILVAEDTGKLLGVLAWAQYFLLTTVDITRSVIDAALARRAEQAADHAALRSSDPVAAS